MHANLPAVHRYYDLRKRKMKLKDGIHMYDTYLPILSDLEKHAYDVAITHDNALARRTRRIVKIQDGRIVEDAPVAAA